MKNPFKKIMRGFNNRYEKFYRGRYLHLIIDIFLLSIVICFSGVLFFLWRYHPNMADINSPIHKELATTTKQATETPVVVKKPKKAPSNLKVQASVLYNSLQGDQLGSGPIPPIATIPTTYWLFFKAENNGNEVDNFLMSAKLPSNVTFTGNKTLSAGTIFYQEDRHLLIWRVNTLAKDQSSYSAGMEISLTPSVQQVGKNCELVTNIRYSANDIEADTELSGTLKSMTSALDFDKINQGQGKVEALD